MGRRPLFSATCFGKVVSRSYAYDALLSGLGVALVYESPGIPSCEKGFTQRPE